MPTRGGGVRVRDRVPFVRAAAFGGLAYVVGYVLTYAVTVIDSVDPGQYGNDAMMIVGWRFYAAHFVGLGTRSGDGIGPAELLGGGFDSLVPPVAYHLLPPVVLVLAGYHAIYTADIQFRKTGTAVTAGASLVGGYLPLAVLGAVLFRVHGDPPSLALALAEVTGPGLLESVALVGLLIPAVCGAIGAWIGLYVQRARARSSARADGVEG
jgi:hypothetical protein